MVDTTYLRALPDLSLVPHQENDHPRLLTEAERDVLKCMYLWVQSGLKVYRGNKIVNDIPSCKCTVSLTKRFGGLYSCTNSY